MARERISLGRFVAEYSVRNKGDEDIPVYSVTNSQGFCTEYFGKEVASQDKTTYKIVPRGYFAYNPSRINVGSVDWQRTEDRVIVSPLYNVFSVSDEIDRQYLYYFLRSDIGRQIIKAKASGSVRDNLKLDMLKEMTVPNMSIREQRACATVLDKIQLLIHLQQEQLSTLDTLIKARFVEMFGDCKANPKGWKTKHLGDVAAVGSSKRVFVEDLKEEGVPFYRGTEVGALAEGKSISPELFIAEEHYIELCKATGTPKAGDLLMPSICPDGRIWVVNTEEPFYFKDGRVLWVHDISAEYDPIFLLYTLKDRIIIDYPNIASGTTFAELKIFALKQCQVFAVPLDLQRQFTKFISHVDKSKFIAQEGRNLCRFALQYICRSISCGGTA